MRCTRSWHSSCSPRPQRVPARGPPETHEFHSPDSPPLLRTQRCKLLDVAIKRHQFRPDALIEVLHSAQEVLGFLDIDVLVYVGRAPRAAVVTVTGESFGMGERLCPAARRVVPRAIRMVVRQARAFAAAGALPEPRLA